MTRYIRLLCWLLLLTCAGVVWQNNHQAGLYSDDYLYSFKFNPGFVNADPAKVHYEKIADPGDYLQSLKLLYVNLTGRIVPHALLQLFLLLPAWVFDLLNTLALFGLTFLFTTWIIGWKSRLFPLYWLLATFLYYLAVANPLRNFYLPAFSCNYLWTQLLVFLFLIPLRKLLEMGDNRRSGLGMALVMLLVGLLAGDTNEPVVPAVLMAMGLYAVYRLLLERKRLPGWYYTGFAGMLIGFAFLYFAPGNSQRALYETGTAGTRQIGLSIANLRPMLFTVPGLMPALLLGLLGLLRLKRPLEKSQLSRFGFLLLLLLGVLAALLISPFFLGRMNILFVGFGVILCLQLLYQNSPRAGTLMVLAVLLLPVFALKLGGNYLELKQVQQEERYFRRQIAACKADSCLVDPRANLDPLTLPNWAKPVAEYYHKRYLWVRNDFDPAMLQNWKDAHYTPVQASNPDQVRLVGLKYFDHNPWCRTLYATLQVDTLAVPVESLKVVFYAADISFRPFRELTGQLPSHLLDLTLPAQQNYRVQKPLSTSEGIVFAFPMAIEDGTEDYIRFRVDAGKSRLGEILVKDVSFR